MPQDGDTRIVRRGLTFQKYTYIIGEPGYADGWWDTNEDPPAYGGNGKEVDTNAVEPKAVESEPSDAALLYEWENPGETWPPTTFDKDGNKIPDKTEIRYWQSEVFRQRKAAQDAEAKAAETARLEDAKTAETTRIEEAKAAEVARKEQANAPVSTGAQPIFSPDGQYFKSSDTDQWQRVPTTAAKKTPTLDELTIEAILSGDDEAALALQDFASMPSQTERLNLALQYAQRPADYLAIVGMMRGEIPIGPSGSSWRLGPESQAFAAMGVNGQQGSPLDNPALKKFLAGRGGGQGAGASTAAPGASTAMPGTAQELAAMVPGGSADPSAPMSIGERQRQAPGGAAASMIERQIQALVAAADQAQSPEEQQEIQAEIAKLQAQQAAAFGAAQGQTWKNPGTSPELAAIDRQIQALVSAGDDASPEEQAQIQQLMEALQQQRQQVWQSQKGGGQKALATALAEPESVPDPTGNPNMIGIRDRAGTVHWANRNDQESIAWARKQGGPTSKTTQMPSAAPSGNPDWDALTESQKAYNRANGQGPESYHLQLPSSGTTLSTRLSQAPGGGGSLPSHLQQAYGKEVLSGAALSQRMSYPELAERQGVTMPRFRSAQARSMQTPLEQRLFEAGLAEQGIDLPTFLAQERAGTTPGGARRRRIQTVSR